MSGPTTIRIKEIAGDVGMVTTVFNRRTQKQEAFFQVYQVNGENNHTWLGKTEVWDTEADAISQFDKWLKEMEETS